MLQLSQNKKYIQLTTFYDLTAAVTFWACGLHIYWKKEKKVFYYYICIYIVSNTNIKRLTFRHSDIQYFYAEFTHSLYIFVAWNFLNCLGICRKWIYNVQFSRKRITSKIKYFKPPAGSPLFIKENLLLALALTLTFKLG